MDWGGGNAGGVEYWQCSECRQFFLVKDFPWHPQAKGIRGTKCENCTPWIVTEIVPLLTDDEKKQCWYSYPLEDE